MRKGIALFGLFILVGFLGLVACGPPPPLPPGEKGSDAGTPDTQTQVDVAPRPDVPLPEGGQKCITRCDCPQGLECSSGTCVSGTQAVYCCEKSGCEPGKECQSRRGNKSTCGIAGATCNSACDCVVGLGCLNGQCTQLPTPFYCCSKPSECPGGAKCEDSKGQEGTCSGTPPKCQTHCDCPQEMACTGGSCVRNRTPTFCCSKPGCTAGQACHNSDGTPGVCGNAPKCTNANDCGKNSCSASGSSCVQEYFQCVQGECKKLSSTVPNASCAASGKCEARSACTSHCDCEGSKACVNGQCSEVPGQPFWCCSDPNCPNGAVCYRSDNSKATCGSSTGGCKGDKDCPPTSCQDSGVDCYENQYACDTATGKCVTSRFAFRKSFCDQSKGRCTPSATACKLDCDCGQREACVSGRCTITTTPKYCCDKAGCPAGQACTDSSGKASTCGNTTGCKADSECGKAYCIQQGRDCITKAPKCSNSSCSEVSTTASNKVCDRATGACVAGCFADSDCSKASCKQNGKFCERTVGQCRSGQCQSSTTSDVGTCDTSTGICKPPTSCRNHCECAQGYFCYQGKCARSSHPVYCCENPGCPSGATCYGTLTNQPSRCPVLCASACDCPEGQDCQSGKCVKGSAPVYCCNDATKCPVGASCKDNANKAGTCPQRPRPCKTACDCIQGEGCVNGQCTKGSTPVYCCEKDGCPLAQGCVSKNQLSGLCPKSCNGHCDCPQGENCVQGKCTNNPAISGRVFCCTNPNCPAQEGCYHADGRFDRCPAQRCSSPCDCNQGEDCQGGRCVQTTPPVYCCSKSGCRAGEACKDSSNKWSTCKNTQACKTHCDCAQGQDCFQGQCVGVHPAIYCCNKTGCPSGQACYDNANKKSYCPTTTCKTACDCPVQGQSCIRGACVYVTGAARVYCCNKPYCPAGQKCEDSQGNLKLCSKTSCKSPCDCRLGEDCRNGTCVNVSPPVYCCTASICPSRASCVKADGSRSVCP